MEERPYTVPGLRSTGAEILRQLDAAGSQRGQSAAQPVATAEDRLEEAIAARRQLRSHQGGDSRPAMENGKGKVVVTADDDVEVLIASRRRVRSGKAGGFCPKCGGPVQQADRFCPKCGCKI